MSAPAVQVERLRGGPWGQNCYLVARESHAVLIDPGGNADDLASTIDRAGLLLLAIVNTHGHFDHIGAVQPLIDRFGVPFYISAREVPIMKTSNMLRFIFKSKEKVIVPRDFVDLDGEPLDLVFGSLTLRRIETPGHTPGGHCLLIDGHLFSGDTVLPSMPGSAELPGGDPAALEASLRLLATLPQDTTLHPGHGSPTTLGASLALIFANSTTPKGHPA